LIKPPPTDELLAAQAVLLTLSAALDRANESRFTFGSNTQPLDLESAASYLSVLEKPLVCTAEATASDTIRVNCVAEKPDATVLDITTATSILAANSKTSGGADILLIAAGHSLLLTARVLKHWTNDYRVGVPFSIAGDDPTPEQQKLGIRYVLKAFPPAVMSYSLDDFDLPRELADVIKAEFDELSRQAERQSE
jgi:hypothetical protein